MKLFFGAAIISAAVAIAGCGASTTILLTDSTGVNAGTFEVGDTPIPAVSYQTGPRFFASTRKDGINGIRVIATASITNETHALGIYDSYERKCITIEAEARTDDTNAVIRVDGKTD